MKSFTKSLACKKELEGTFIGTCHHLSLERQFQHVASAAFIHCLLHLDPLPHPLNDPNISSFLLSPKKRIHEKRRKPRFKYSVMFLWATCKRHGQNLKFLIGYRESVWWGAFSSCFTSSTARCVLFIIIRVVSWPLVVIGKAQTSQGLERSPLMIWNLSDHSGHRGSSDVPLTNWKLSWGLCYRKLSLTDCHFPWWEDWCSSWLLRASWKELVTIIGSQGRKDTALALGLGMGMQGRGTVESSWRRRKEEEVFNELSSHPEDGTWLVSVFHSYGDIISIVYQGAWADTRICVISRCENCLGKRQWKWACWNFLW